MLIKFYVKLNSYCILRSMTNSLLLLIVLRFSKLIKHLIACIFCSFRLNIKNIHKSLAFVITFAN